MTELEKAGGKGWDAGSSTMSGSTRVPSIIPHPLRLLIIILGAIFVGESVIMLVIHKLMPPLRHELVGLIDALVLMITLIPLLYVFYYKPLKRNISLLEISERKNNVSNINLQKALTKLEKTQDVLIRSEKLASLGLLSAGVAHEIKNPVNIIFSNIQLIMMEDNLPDDVKKSCETMFGQVKRMVKIINNLRDFARDRKPEIVAIDLHSFLDKTIALVEYEMKSESIDVRKDYFREPIMIAGDQDQLAQVFLNIINNARDSMNEKRLLAKEKKPGLLFVKTDVGGEGVQIEIKDNGTGIRAGVIARIFDPFVTTKPEDKGTGLGLSIAHGIIENHGGTIHATSDPDEGATFTITLPLPTNSGSEN